ncbi:hypothetical protein B0H19DRAFT_1265373 [Mycena capillaripes]|nr:hypothetical protein B0H19DRAFT_1265373 [Mycena capillaripes]
MPPKPPEIWGVFHRSDNKLNGSHHRATHWRSNDDEDDLPSSIPVPTGGRHRAQHSWLPTTLIGVPLWREHVVSEESLYMELLAAEHSDEEPDTGAQEDPGDDYDG